MSPESRVNENIIMDYRKSIDNMDGAFMFLLSERMRVVSRVSLLKNKFKVNNDKTGARKKDLKKIFSLADNLKLNTSLIKAILDRIYDEAQLIIDKINKDKNDVMHSEDFDSSLKELRKTIFNLDSAFCFLLAERFNLVVKVGHYKGRHNLKPLAVNRWKEILESKKQMSMQLGISVKLVCDILELIHRESLRIESEIIKAT